MAALLHKYAVLSGRQPEGESERAWWQVIG